MTCPRPHCGGLLFEDEGEWVCKSCSRRWTDAALDLERTRMSAPKAAQPSAIDEAMLDRRLDELLHDEEDGEPEEETIMAERCQKPRGRGRCKADAVPGSNFCRDCGAPPKPEARSPKRRGRPPRPSPAAGGFDQAAPASNGHGLTESWMDRKARMLVELREAETNLAAELAKVREAVQVVEGL